MKNEEIIHQNAYDDDYQALTCLKHEHAIKKHNTSEMSP